MCGFYHLLFAWEFFFEVDVASAISVNDSQTDTYYPIDYYEYEIPDNWDTMSVLERVQALQIPDEVLSQMSDDALVQAVADYPYLVDIYLYGDGVSDGIEVARQYFSALNELLLRNNATISLANYCSDACYAYNATEDDADSDSLHSQFVSKAMSDILSAVHQANGVQTLVDVDDLNHSGVGEGYVYTPAGGDDSKVPMLLFKDETTLSERQALDAEIVSTYGVTLVSNATSTYNCHSYAWNMPFTDCACWIDNITIYQTDGSYSRVYTGYTSVATSITRVSYGDIILYANNSHSAIFVGTPQSEAPLATMLCISKWTHAGVFRHTVTNVPAGYSYSTISVWTLEE